MFNEAKLSDFLRQFPDATIEVAGEVGDDGEVRWEGRISEPTQDGTVVVVAEAAEANLRQLPCALADDLRNRLGQASSRGGPLPTCQRTALDEGIPGIVRYRPGMKVRAG